MVSAVRWYIVGVRTENIIEQMQTLVSQLSAFLKSRPGRKTIPGILRISKQRGVSRYYIKENLLDKTGKYTSASKMDVIRTLAQQEYESDIYEETEKTILGLNKCLGILSRCKDPEDVYDQLPENRKVLVTKQSQTKVSVEKWKCSTPSRKHGFDKTNRFIVARNGLRVRSKSEEIIVNIFEELQIPYIYESSMVIDDQIVYPDFRILNVRTGKEYIYEHCGMMNDEDYVNRNVVRKIYLYAKNGIHLGDSLLMTFETREQPLNEQYLIEFFKRFFL